MRKYYISLFNSINTRSAEILFGLAVFLCIAFRVWFWYATDLTFEDALITFRYAENIASGNGFVYNTGENIQGTTTPAWTLLLAGIKYSGINIFAAGRIISILLDTVTCILIFLILRSFGIRLAIIFAFLFSTSHVIIPVSVSGMETSLLLFTMSMLLTGYVRKNILFGIGMTLAVLTRIDAVLYVLVFLVSGMISDRKWALRQMLIACLCYAPWFIFSFAYFGNVLPQSLLAKGAVYKPDLSMTAGPFLNYFTPFLDTQPLKILLKSVIFFLLVTGMVILFKRKSKLFPLVIFTLLYCLLFIFSGTIIFSWYLVPPILISYIITAAAIDWCIDNAQRYTSKRIPEKISFPISIVSILLINTFFILGRSERYRELQDFEDEIRKPIGVWLKENAQSGSKIFLEPLGYIGYFAGKELVLWDEIGLVNRKVVECRKGGNDWYIRSIKELRPDYVVQYAEAIEQNKSEGTQTPLFKDNSDRIWFYSHFDTIMKIETAKSYYSIEQKEKRYIIFKKKSSL